MPQLSRYSNASIEYRLRYTGFHLMRERCPDVTSLDSADKWCWRLHWKLRFTPIIIKFRVQLRKFEAGSTLWTDYFHRSSGISLYKALHSRILQAAHIPRSNQFKLQFAATTGWIDSNLKLYELNWIDPLFNSSSIQSFELYGTLRQTWPWHEKLVMTRHYTLVTFS